jgi:hypothetical protein
MTDSQHVRELDEQALRMICSISSGMLGICFTGISLMRLFITIRHRQTLADDLLSANALMFLFTIITSYYASRTINARRMRRLEGLSDKAFLASMGCLTLNCFFVTYAVSL